MKRNLVSLVLSIQTLVFCGAAGAATVPFTESFTSNASGWLGPGSAQSPVYSATGGVSGGYIQHDPANAFADTSLPGNGLVVFRANSSASGGAFTGNWLTAGINNVQAYVKHTVPNTPVEFYVRLSAGPAAVFFSHQTVLPSTDWTLVNFEISPANYTDAGGTYNTVLAGVTNFQIGARITSTPQGVSGVAAIDNVSLVPEPSSALLAIAAVVGGLAARRRRS